MGQKWPKRVKIEVDSVGKVKQQKRNKIAQITTPYFLHPRVSHLPCKGARGQWTTKPIKSNLLVQR